MTTLICLLLYACVNHPNLNDSGQSPATEVVTPSLDQDTPLVELSLKELMSIPLNQSLSDLKIHQLDSNPMDENTINFGILAPVSEFPVYSAEIIAAADAAAELVNQHGGIDGHRLVILRADDKENTPVSAKLAEQLVNTYQVQAILGPATSDSVANVLQQVTIPNQIPLITQAASAIYLTEIGGPHLFWRMVVNNYQQVALITQFLHQQQGHKRIFLLTGRDLYSREILQGISDYYQQFDDTYFENLSISDRVFLDEMDLRQEIEQMQKNGVTAIVVTLVNSQVKSVLKKISKLWQGKYPVILIGDTVTPKYLIDAELGDIDQCIFSYVGTSQDLKPELSQTISAAIETSATGFDGAYIFDATMILAMAKVLNLKESIPFKQAVNLITGEGYPIQFSDFAKITQLYQQHGQLSYYGQSGRVHFNQTGDNLTGYKKIYSIAKDATLRSNRCLISP